MAVSPEERFHQRQPRYSKEEFTQRGNALYESKIRLQVEQNHRNKIVAIDIETGEFEIGDDSLRQPIDFSNAFPMLNLGAFGLARVRFIVWGFIPR